VHESDRAAEFVGFVRAHRRDLMRTAVLLCAGDEGFAEDVVQTTLTRMYLSWPRVRRSDAPLAYARKALTHVFIDEYRRAHRRHETLLDRPNEYDEAREPRTELDDRDLRGDIIAALDRLGPRQRAVVVLRHWLDLDVAETARMLGCSVGTVKSQNARALTHLRETLGPIRLVDAEETP
jgi:RNA polymerase sigma-70 factor (sigma-E family)